MIGEYLPFRWGVEYDKTKIDFSIKDPVKECAAKAYGTVPASSMICNFALYNGSNASKNQETPIWK
jgi:hypothetical protein